MGVNSLPKTVTRQRRDCDLNPGPSAPESSTLTTRYTVSEQEAHLSTAAARVCCCGSGRQEMAIDCCTAGAQQKRRAVSRLQPP